MIVRLAIVIAGVLLASVAGAGVIEDFEQPHAWSVYNGEVRGGAFARVPTPGGRGSSAELSWNRNHAGYLELHSAQPVEAFRDRCEGTVSVRVYSPGTPDVTGVALRLLDAHGEVFQWRTTEDFSRPGWRDLVFRIEPGSAMGHWGGDGNGEPDCPMRLMGVAIDFDPRITRDGRILFDDFSVLGSGRTVETRRPLWTFDDGEMWSRYADGVTLDQTKQGLVMRVAPSSDERYIPLAERFFTLRAEKYLHGIRLRAELLSERGVALTLRLRDAKGEIHSLRPKEMHPGLNDLTWSIPGDRADSWGDNRDGVIDFPVHMHELFAICHKGEGEAKVRFISADRLESLPELEAIQVAVETGNPVHVLKPGEEARLALRITNTADEARAFRMDVALNGYSAGTPEFGKRFDIPAHTTVMWGIPAPRTRGIWWVDYRLTSTDSDASAVGRRSFAYMKPAGPTKGRGTGFLFGMNTHSERWSLRDAETEVAAAAMCGAKVVRTGPSWGAIEPSDGVLNWDTLDRLVDLYRRNGVEIQYLLGETPAWAVANQSALARGWDYYRGQCPRMDPWRRFVSQTVGRYKGRIRFWEVWNEPDIGFWTGNLEEYLRMLAAAGDEVHRADPDSQVMTGGIAVLSSHPEVKEGFVDGMVARGVHDYDILAMHLHGGFPSFQHDVDGRLPAIRRTMPSSKRLYFNETAIASMGGDERLQAETLVKKLTLAWARGAMGYSWYDLRNDGFDPNDVEHCYGAMTNDFYPKAVYPTYNTLALYLTGKRYVGQLPLSPDHWGFVFADAKEQVVAAWSEVAGEPDESVVLKTDATKAFRVDLMGNETAVSIVEGRVVLPVSTVPGYLRLVGARTVPKVQGALVSVRGAQVAVPGKDLVVKAELGNPFSRPIKYVCTWRVQGKATPGRAVVVPGGRKGVSTAKVRVPSTGDCNLALDYRVAGMDLQGSVDVPVRTALLIRADGQERQPTFVMEDRSHIVSLCDNDPTKSALVWQGLRDLSARVWLTGSKDALSVNVIVQDDIECQPNRGADVWQGDGVQCALSIPGQRGYWELGLTRLADGSPEVFCWTRPEGLADPSGRITLSTERIDGRTGYSASLPYSALGLSEAQFRAGIQFSLIVNDNDGGGREGWAFASRGIGETKNPALFPFVVLDR